MPRLVSDLGPALVVGVRGAEPGELTGVVVSDPVHPVTPVQGDLLVAVGYPPEACAELQQAAHAAGAGALLVKGHRVPDVDESLVPVVVIDPAADWGHVVALARLSVQSGPVLTALEGDSLFALADALAALCGGSVVLHDAGWQLLAYSGGEVSDTVRSQTLLGRRAPVETLEQLRTDGVIDRLMRGELVHLADQQIKGMSERYAAAVLVNGQLFGTIWVTPTSDQTDAEHLAGLQQAVDVAALSLLRHASMAHGPGPERDLDFAGLLGGAHTERLVAQRLGVELDAGFVLVGLRPVATDPVERAATARRLLGLARSYCDAYRVTALAAAHSDTTYLLFSCADTEDRARAVRVLADMHGRIKTALPHRILISSTYQRLTDTSSVRPVVEDLLELAERRNWSGLTDTEDVQATWRLEQFREVALAHPALLEGPGMRLVEHDRANGGELLVTLRAYFAAVGDVRAAADALGLHYNTVRYRLRKAAEVAQLDLDDPDQRLLAELQVRLLSS